MTLPENFDPVTMTFRNPSKSLPQNFDPETGKLKLDPSESLNQNEENATKSLPEGFDTTRLTLGETVQDRIEEAKKKSKDESSKNVPSNKPVNKTEEILKTKMQQISYKVPE